MKTFVILAAAFVCVQALAVPKLNTTSSNSESSEEEYRVILPAGDKRPISLAGVGAGKPPLVLKSVEVEVPRNANPSTKQHLISQALKARGIGIEAQKQVLVVRDRRQSSVTTAAKQEVTTVEGELASTSTIKAVSANGGVTKAPAIVAGPIAGKSNK